MVKFCDVPHGLTFMCLLCGTLHIPAMANQFHQLEIAECDRALGSQVNVVLKPHHYSPFLDVEAVRPEITDVIGLALSYLRRLHHPHEIRVHLAEEGRLADFDYKANIVRLALKLTDCADDGCRNAVLLHEIAHVIFQYNLRRFSPKFRELYDLYLLNSRFEAEFLEAMVEISRLETLSTKEARTRELAQILGPLREANGPTAKRMRSESYEWRMTLTENAYEEVFADLLPVVITRDPHVSAEGEQRRFDRVFTTSEIEAWDPKDDHFKLDPVKSFLYSSYLAGRTDWSQIDVFLEKVAIVLARDIGTRDADPNLRLMATPKINVRLIRLLGGIEF